MHNMSRWLVWWGLGGIKVDLAGEQWISPWLCADDQGEDQLDGEIFTLPYWWHCCTYLHIGTNQIRGVKHSFFFAQLCVCGLFTFWTASVFIGPWSDLWVRVTESKTFCRLNRCDSDSIPTDDANRTITGIRQCKWRHLVAKFVTNASGATWWCQNHRLLATFTSNASSAIWRPQWVTEWLSDKVTYWAVLDS